MTVFLPATFLIVWRESFEAVLILGILSAALGKFPATKAYKKYLWFGCALGVFLSICVALLMDWTTKWVSSAMRVYLEFFFYLLSAVLMVQMVIWLSTHARSLKTSYQNSLQTLMAQFGPLGVMLFSTLIIAREGSEAAIYVYSMNVSSSTSVDLLLFNVGLGILAAVSFSRALAYGFQTLKTEVFFRWTGYFFLLSACGLVTAAAGKLVDENIVPGLIEPVYNFSKIMSSESMGARVLHFFNFNLRPSLVEAIVFLMFWILILILRRKSV